MTAPVFLQLTLADFRHESKPSLHNLKVSVHVQSIAAITPIHPTTQVNYKGSKTTVYIKGGGVQHVQESYDDIIKMLQSREFGFINY